MSQSLADVCIHLTFSTYLRRLYLDADSRRTLFPYMIGILRNLGATVLQIGGADEHVHVLFRMPKNIALMNLIQQLKGSSSRFLKTEGTKHRAFSWQAGYCAISVSPRAVENVIRYIANQEKHHRTESFQQEFLRMLREENMPFDETHLWD